ncbi:hypothetical protein SADFL11_00011550 [Roseibium alexandrii DFL-11]|uniref:Uncharacterized protein n=1 Tax=Roseibium alexandrii (strain DSM 17067 / NCIMB 14079 / DFL-11) TaxID=244592 RepID=A0A5E8UX82_ROSAD|nr:hypothetical protein SADFL11_00011550 [Roseibium alexandrii DFL-11]
MRGWSDAAVPALSRDRATWPRIMSGAAPMLLIIFRIASGEDW